jgi:hypothetical protein
MFCGGSGTVIVGCIPRMEDGSSRLKWSTVLSGTDDMNRGKRARNLAFLVQIQRSFSEAFLKETSYVLVLVLSKMFDHNVEQEAPLPRGRMDQFWETPEIGSNI